MEEKKNFMLTKPVLPLLISMAVPMMLSMLIQSLYNIVDSIFVSRLGTEALTAVSLVFPIQNIVMSISVGMAIGIGSAISMYLGQKNQAAADKAATIGMCLTVVHCLLFVIFGLLVTKPFLSLFTSDPNTLTWACQYSYIVLCFSSGGLLQISFEKIFQSVGAMLTTMVALTTGCIINIILDPIFIFGLFGVPKLGVAGAAIATVIGQFSSLAIYLVICARKNIGVSINKKSMCFDKAMIRRIYGVGIPSSIMLGLPSVLVTVLNAILIGFSELYVAVLGIYLKLQTFIYMPANGIIQGMRPIVGYNFGAGERERTTGTIRWSMILAASIMAIGTLIALAVPETLLSMFNADETLMSSGVEAIRIISLGFMASTVSVVCSGAFEAFGHGKESLIVSMLRQFSIIIVLGFLLSRIWGVIGIWIAYPVAEFVAAAVAWVLYRNMIHNTFPGSAAKGKKTK